MRPIISVTEHCYRPLIQADVFAVFLMKELKNLPNVIIGKLCKLVQDQNCSHDFFSILNELKNLAIVVIGKLGKLVHEQNCSHDFVFYFMYYNIISVHVRYITIDNHKK